ncbi:MAG: dephospho-CoA kinase [Lachnospiraceae bacterium]|nr:dephospho-CoA kinase [Lachnospiraceae bacterium]
MKVIGLTGGIGSGKSFVADIAEKHFNIMHINTDEIARRQMLKGGTSYGKVVEEFSKYSDRLLDEDGEINRQVLGKIVLNDENLIKKLDSLTHPDVIEEVNGIIASEKEKKEKDAVLIETALLYEAGIDGMCDEVWYVYAPMATRRRRLKDSRGYSEEKIDGFFSKQHSEEDFLRLADRTVPNGEDVTEADMVKIIKGYL